MSVVFSVCDFSSQSQKHPATNLLNDDEESLWKCNKWRDYSWIVLQADEEHLIEVIEVTNASSAFIEVFVSSSVNDNYKVLVPVFSAMSPSASKQATDCKRKFTLTPKNFSPYTANHPWKYIKFVCSQPFNKSIRFGLSVIRICGNKGETNTIERQFSPFGKFKLKVAPNNFNKDIFAQRDLKYKKDLIGKYEQSQPKSVQPNEEDEKSERANGKRPRKDKVKEENRADDERKMKKHKPIKEVASAPSVSSGGGGGARGEPSNWPQQPSTSATTGRCRKDDSGPKNAKPLERVHIVLSGYVDPLRSELREKATSMGARYSPKWESNSCTHLICAVPNTPKYNEVKRLNGRIVSHKWILDCYAQRRLLEWRNYMVGTYGGPDTPQHSEEEEEEKEGEKMETEKSGVIARVKTNATACVAANDKRSAFNTNGNDSDVIYDLETESEDEDD